MPSSWENKQKAEAIQRLMENLGDVTDTAEQTNIPARTLWDWRSEIRKKKKSILLQYTAINPVQQEIHEQYVFIRNDLISHIHKLSKQMKQNPENAAQLAIAFSRLVDRLTKAEALVQKTTTYALIILWEHPDGTVHDKPVWERIVKEEAE